MRPIPPAKIRPPAFGRKPVGRSAAAEFPSGRPGTIGYRRRAFSLLRSGTP